MKDVFISIIVPAYNEEENIVFTLSSIFEYLREKNFSSEVILIDDGSRDMTVQKARKFKDSANLAIIENAVNRGKGYVLKKAMLEAKGEYIMFTDADSSVSIETLDKFLPILNEGFDIYIASRKIEGAKVTASLKRVILGNIYVFLSKLLLGISVNDINCGFKLFRHEAAKKVFSKQIMDDWSFDAEILFIAARYGYKIKEIPVEWVHKATSKVKPLGDGIRSFRSLIAIRDNAKKNMYD